LGTRGGHGCWSSASRNDPAGYGLSPRGGRRGLKRHVMKKTRRAKAAAGNLRAEYEFDYAKGRKNRFAAGGGRSTVAVVLEPDVARVFGSSAEVNRLLRSVIQAVPGATRVERKRKAG
jgi:hypothetical protein